MVSIPVENIIRVLHEGEAGEEIRCVFDDI